MMAGGNGCRPECASLEIYTSAVYGGGEDGGGGVGGMKKRKSELPPKLSERAGE